MTTPETGPATPKTIEQIATAAAALVTEARQAGLTPPRSLSCHDYGQPTASLYLFRHDNPDIWHALQEWATRYGTQVTSWAGIQPGSIHAAALWLAITSHPELAPPPRQGEGDQVPT